MFVAGGLFDSTGTSFSSGIIDVNDNGLVPAAAGNTLSATVMTPTNGRGTMTLTVASVNTLSPGQLSQFAYYPTASNGVLLFELDQGFPSAGTAFASTAGAPFSGNYAMRITGFLSVSATVFSHK